MNYERYQPMTDEELNMVLAQALEVDVHFEEVGAIINRTPRCGYCGMAITTDPTDEESWVHTVTGDGQCIVDDVPLNSWAIPNKEDRP